MKKQALLIATMAFNITLHATEAQPAITLSGAAVKNSRFTPRKRYIAASGLALVAGGLIATNLMGKDERRKTKQLFAKQSLKQGLKRWFTTPQGLSILAATGSTIAALLLARSGVKQTKIVRKRLEAERRDADINYVTNVVQLSLDINPMETASEEYLKQRYQGALQKLTELHCDCHKKINLTSTDCYKCRHYKTIAATAMTIGLQKGFAWCMPSPNATAPHSTQ